MKSKSIRVRFAPSPTGPLHLGGVRTALYNYLFAKKNKGKFILRIEDTDQKRFIPYSESYILETLKWCKINPDEGVGYGNGPYYPYHQSKRNKIYLFYLNKLIKKGLAYYSFDTNNYILKKKEEFKKKGLEFSYNYENRLYMKNSLSMSKKEFYNKLENKVPYVIRFKVIPNLIIKVHDLVRGTIKMNTKYLDDKILLKSNGNATYHLANTIDDHLMMITHVLRGEEWITSMFFHILLYNSFEWDPPFFAHLPLILNKNGKGKISKRNFNSMENPIFPIEWKNPETKTIIPGYRELGYFSESFINMVALLGWNPGNNQEILSLKDLEKYFSIEKIKKSGVFFDIKKAKWINKKYIFMKKKEVFFFLQNELKKRYILIFDKEYLWKVIYSTIDRIYFIHEIWGHTFYFFIPPNSYDKNIIKKMDLKNSIFQLKKIRHFLSNLKIKFSSKNLEKLFFKYEKIWNKKNIMKLIRLSLVGSLKGVNLFLILEIIGKKNSLYRIDKFIDEMSNQYIKNIDL